MINDMRDLTDRALDFCGFLPDSYLADIGCGDGADAEYLRSRGFNAWGLDKTPANKEHCIAGDASVLPFKSDNLDGLFYTCSLSQMNQQAKVLDQALRVLKKGGKLVVSDLYARNKNYSGKLFCEREWQDIISRSGFNVLFFEDHSRYIKSMAAHELWQSGPEGFFSSCGLSYEELKSARCGYFLLIAEKK